MPASTTLALAPTLLAPTPSPLNHTTASPKVLAEMHARHKTSETTIPVMVELAWKRPLSQEGH